MAHAVLDSLAYESNPLDAVEQIALANGWTFDRLDDDEIAAEVAGPGTAYHLWFAWRPDREVLHVSCAFDVKVPERRRGELYPLLAMINQRLAIGHFDLWPDDGMVMFRQALPLRGGPGVSLEQLQDLIEVALDECGRYYPTFHFVIWGGTTASEAMAAALFDTVGEA